MQFAYLAGGCFWCIEAIFQRVQGVKSVVSGYCNGQSKNPNYQEVCSGSSGHAEVVEIKFDESEINYSQLLDIFFSAHDYTTLNRQGNDVGTQYRSAIFYQDTQQKELALDKIPDNAVTEITQLDVFYPAEDYHQNYYNNNPEQPYCMVMIEPKLRKLFS